MSKNKKPKSAKNKALQQLEDFTDNTDLTVSSDSEDEAKEAKKQFKGKADKELVDESRIMFKVVMLAAIARSVFLPNDEIIDLYDNLEEKRKDDGYKNYEEETMELAREIATSYLPVNLHHNPYFRRSFREVVSNDDMEHGSSKAYNEKQGKIRTSLAKVIKEDFKKMNLTKKDFEFIKDIDQIWPVIEYIASGKELAGTDKNNDFKTLLVKLRNSGANVGEKGVAFHHLVWKKAFKGMFEESAALNPANLIALNDTRGEKGDHDKIHTHSSYPKGHTEAEGGGKFRDMDAAIVGEMAAIHLHERKPKAEIYGAMASSLQSVTKKKRGSKKEEIGKDITPFMR